MTQQNNNDDYEDISQMSRQLVTSISEIFNGNEYFICLNALTNSVSILLDEFDNDFTHAEMVDRFCNALKHTLKHLDP